jgi:uncharacterized protein YdeI (YjbR/CyaY-like superfamily)
MEMGELRVEIPEELREEMKELPNVNKMVTLTVSIPDELKKRMDEHPEINWSAFLKERFARKVEQLRKFEELVNKGEI